jgi:hypothetical protein
MITYNKFISILNKHLFEGEKRELLKTIADHPERFVGLFRPTKPKAKILQYLLQSHEIKFGDAIEEILTEIIKELGYQVLDKHIQVSDREVLKIDQYFSKRSTFYIVEQKMRDDHDSSKKRGQIENFEQKIEFLYKKHNGNIVGIIYFVDPELEKNKNFYEEELKKLSNFYKTQFYLFYGKEFFKFLKVPFLWDDILNWLKIWKDSLPDLPEVNFDFDAEKSFDEIKNLEIRYLRKLFENETLFKEGIIKILFPKGKVLKMLNKYMETQKLSVYKQLSNLLEEKIKKYYL